MRNKSFRYSVLDVDIIYMEPNESFMFEQRSTSGSYGSFKLSGDSWGHVGPQLNEYYTQPHGTWQPNDGNGFSNDTVGHTGMTVTAGPEGASWLCLSRNGSGEREIVHQVVDGEFILPAGWGFVVAQGTVQADGKTAAQANYFKPRAADVTVTGTADLLLVR